MALRTSTGLRTSSGLRPSATVSSAKRYEYSIEDFRHGSGGIVLDLEPLHRKMLAELIDEKIVTYANIPRNLPGGPSHSEVWQALQRSVLLETRFLGAEIRSFLDLVRDRVFDSGLDASETDEFRKISTILCQALDSHRNTR